MKKYDVILIHPPRTITNHSKETKFARTAFIFIPMGVFAIADFLEKEGFGVKIINYPLERYLDRSWKLETNLKSIDFDIVGIDLHWIHNAYGAIEIAKTIKQINPNTKIVFGGFSASYYHDQILKEYKQVDAVIRGEGELPLLKYTQSISKNNSLDSVPNLSYRDPSKAIKANPLSYTARSLDNLNFTNTSLLKNAKQYFECSRKLMGISFNIPVGRGCPFNCPFCSGGSRAQERINGRQTILLRKPENIVEDARIIIDKYKIPSIFFGHGAYPANLNYWKKLFGLFKKENLDIGSDLEIWRLPFPKEMWKIFSKTFQRKHSSISISPRTTSAKIQNKIADVCDPTFTFPINQINDSIKNANMFQRTLRIWLTIGMPFQSILEAQKDFIFAWKCLLKYGLSNQKPITIMNEPYHIFPGSPAFESPEKFGITLKYRQFRQLVDFFKRTKMSFFYNAINYDTNKLSSISIRNSNMFLMLSTALNYLTTGSRLPENNQ